MALLKTPICDFGLNAIDFKLKSINGELLTLNDVKGDNGTLIMFICNHCPYVKAIIRELADDCAKLKKDGINSVAIMSNDTKNYPEDSFENMKKFSDRYNFSFPYLIDETQEIAKKISKNIRDQIKKINVSINGETLRVASKSKNDLQLAIKLVSELEESLNIPLKANNFR